MKLIVLDLDHTLIYGSYADSESSELLFQYSRYLKVYKRPGVEELIEYIAPKSDIVVYTTALRDYASKTCKKLRINYKQLYSRKHCRQNGNGYKKVLDSEYFNLYDSIIIIDDSPNVWDPNSLQRCEFIVPAEFRGNADDREVAFMMRKLRELL
jgi:RNA polymerase II subunit A small phosphatase-like protein